MLRKWIEALETEAKHPHDEKTEKRLVAKIKELGRKLDELATPVML